MVLVGILPFCFLLIRLLPSSEGRLGVSIALLVLLSAAVLWKAPLKTFWLPLICVLPMYYAACLGFADMGFFEARAALSKFGTTLSPTIDYWLGTDYEGRDILATMVIGGKHAYLVALYSSFTALLLGIPIGLFLTSENIISKNLAFWITQFFEIIPQLFFILIVMGVYNFWAAQDAQARLTASYSLPIAGIAIGLSSLPSIARILENRVRQLKAERFVPAFYSTNVNSYKVLLYNILRKNSITEIVVQTTFLFGSALLLESALGFAYEIGFGDLGTGGYLSWGKLLAESRRSILFGENVMIVIPPILATLMSIFGINLLGDKLAQHLRTEN